LLSALFTIPNHYAELLYSEAAERFPFAVLSTANGKSFISALSAPRAKRAVNLLLSFPFFSLPSAGGRLPFLSFFRKLRKQKNPINPVNPVGQEEYQNMTDVPNSTKELTKSESWVNLLNILEYYR